MNHCYPKIEWNQEPQENLNKQTNGVFGNINQLLKISNSAKNIDLKAKIYLAMGNQFYSIKQQYLNFLSYIL